MLKLNIKYNKDFDRHEASLIVSCTEITLGHMSKEKIIKLQKECCALYRDLKFFEKLVEVE